MGILDGFLAEDGHTVEIGGMWVHAERRRTGIGGGLLSAILAGRGREEQLGQASGSEPQPARSTPLRAPRLQAGRDCRRRIPTGEVALATATTMTRAVDPGSASQTRRGSARGNDVWGAVLSDALAAKPAFEIVERDDGFVMAFDARYLLAPSRNGTTRTSGERFGSYAGVFSTSVVAVGGSASSFRRADSRSSGSTRRRAQSRFADSVASETLACFRSTPSTRRSVRSTRSSCSVKTSGCSARARELAGP